MWKVNNTINERYLKVFELDVIEPIFFMIQETVIGIEIGKIMLPLQRKDIWNQTAVFLALSINKQKMFSYIMQKTISGRRLEDVFYDIIIGYDSTHVEYIYKLYCQQNHEVYKGNYSIPQSQVSEYFKELFVNFYYSNFFVDDNIWIILAGEQYNRGSFHKNFRTENSRLAVCPYCDMDTIVAISNISIEHFLPKSKFPLLAMNPYNLISSCTACNKAHEGKGEKVSDAPIITPYNEMIGDSADFLVDFLTGKITLNNKGGPEHENFFKLLKLEARYSEPFIFECVDDAAKSLFLTLSHYGSPTKESINSYISNTKERKEKLSFALKSAIINYPQYKLYK